MCMDFKQSMSVGCLVAGNALKFKSFIFEVSHFKNEVGRFINEAGLRLLFKTLSSG